jgi:hypothetical protein
MTLQLHRPDGQGGLRPRDQDGTDWREELQSPRWGAALDKGRMPRLANREMNPTGRAMSVAVWLGLGGLTFIVLVLGYGTGFWALPG